MKIRASCQIQFSESVAVYAVSRARRALDRRTQFGEKKIRFACWVIMKEIRRVRIFNTVFD